jgi:hypothetical protein
MTGTEPVAFAVDRLLPGNVRAAARSCCLLGEFRALDQPSQSRSISIGDAVDDKKISPRTSTYDFECRTIVYRLVPFSCVL